MALAWLAIWAFALRKAGIPFLSRSVEERARRRERIKQMGKLRYILLFGVFGRGLAFGLAFTIADLLRHRSLGWFWAGAELLIMSMMFGWLSGARTWNDSFRDPVPFPPDFSPMK